MSNIFSLENKTVFITGASAGLGRFFAHTLAKAGADVVIGARRLEKLQEVAKEIEAFGKNALCVSLDVTQMKSVHAAVEQACIQCGKIDVLINNAGNVTRVPSLDYTEADWDGVMDTHLKGSWLMSQAVAKKMIALKTQGSIINISSAMATRTRKNGLVYQAAKAGISHMTRALATELVEHHIRVNALAPGWVVTDLNRELLHSPQGEKIRQTIPMQRHGNFSELEGPILLLASNASSYMTGSILPVDGGYAANSF